MNSGREVRRRGVRRDKEARGKGEEWSEGDVSAGGLSAYTVQTVCHMSMQAPLHKTQHYTPMD